MRPAQLQQMAEELAQGAGRLNREIPLPEEAARPRRRRNPALLALAALLTLGGIRRLRGLGGIRGTTGPSSSASELRRRAVRRTH